MRPFEGIAITFFCAAYDIGEVRGVSPIALLMNRNGGQLHKKIIPEMTVISATETVKRSLARNTYAKKSI